MKSTDIIEGVRQEIIEAGLNIIDPRALLEWCGGRGILAPHLSAATGCSEQAAVDKLRAGNPFRNTPADEYAALSKPLTQENFPGNASTWEIHQPDSYIIQKLAERVDEMDAVRVLYEHLFDRSPDAPGYNFYTTLMDGDTPLSVIVEDMERNKANGAV